MGIYNFGSLNIDRIYSLEHFVLPEETVIAKSYKESFGGKGLNQSIAIARAGAKLHHIGVIGNDGEVLKKFLNKNGVNVDFIYREKVENGHAVIQVDSEGQNCIIVNRGSNGCLSQNKIDGVINSVRSCDIVILQNEVSNVEYIIKKAHEKRAYIILNPSPIDEKLLDSNLKNVNLFILNEIEAKWLCRYFENDLFDLKKELLLKYPESDFLLTLGSEGSHYFNKDTDIKQKSYDVEVVDTTGAGDTYCGYFVASLSKGYDIKECMNIASAASALAITSFGAALSIPNFEEVKKFIKKY